MTEEVEDETGGQETKMDRLVQADSVANPMANGAERRSESEEEEQGR
jgi:hypothetical protein